MAISPTRDDILDKIADVLEYLGLDLTDENFADTPERWFKYLESFCQPYDPEIDLCKAFEAPVETAYAHAMVVQTNIPYQAVCAHHLVPVLGFCHLGYIPSGRVVGLSKLTRLVRDVVISAPSLQE